MPPADISIEVDADTPDGGWIRMYVEVSLQSSCRWSKLVAGIVSMYASLRVPSKSGRAVIHRGQSEHGKAAVAAWPDAIMSGGAAERAADTAQDCC